MKYALLAVCFLAGCASTAPPRFSHPTADQSSFMRDRYACLQEGRDRHAQGNRAGYESKGVVNGGVFRSCMVARGYQLDPNGRFTPPPGTEVVTVD